MTVKRYRRAPVRVRASKRSQARLTDLALKDEQLVPERQNLDVLLAVVHRRRTQ
jgi:hypothetical protein